MVFRARHWFRLIEFQVATLFGLFGLILTFSTPKVVAVVFSTLCGLVSVVAILSVLRYAHKITIETDRLTLQQPMRKPRVFSKSELHKVQAEIAKSSSRIMISTIDGHRLTLAPLLFADPPRLINSLRGWIRPGIRYGSYRTLKNGMALFPIPILTIVGLILTWPRVSQEQIITVVALNLLILILGFLVLSRRIDAAPFGLTFHVFGRESHLRWDQIEQFKLYSTSGKTQFESASIEGNGQSWRIGFYDDYLGLRDTILSNISPSIVVDNRSYF